jgi:hypothetical protein
MYITDTEYKSFTGRPKTEATKVRIRIASKLLDNRIGNHGVYSNGWKIDKDSYDEWYVDNNTLLAHDQVIAVKMWVSVMVSCLYDNDNKPVTNKNVKLGRFSVGNSGESSIFNKVLPDEMAYQDSILISSGIIKRAIDIR